MSEEIKAAPEQKEEMSDINQKMSFSQKFKAFINPQGIEKEMLRYRPNKASGNSAIFGMICAVVALSIVYSNIKRGVDWRIGIDILGAIIILLGSFMASEEMKAYSKQWSYISFGLAALSVVRIFTYPLYLYNYTYEATVITYNADGSIKSTAKVLNHALNAGLFTAVIILLCLAAFFYILAGIISLYRGKALREYLAANRPMQNEILTK
jgi:hypothetical protein